MVTPVTPDVTPTVPLDDERARLRKAGFTEDRIDAFLRSSDAPQASQTAGSFARQQAPMSGTVGNISAAIGYAQGVIPAVQKEIATAGDRGAPATRRVLAFGALALIAALVVAIGYGISLELSILKNQAEITAQQVREAKPKADAMTDTFVDPRNRPPIALPAEAADPEKVRHEKLKALGLE